MTEPAEFLEQLRAALPVRAASATVSVTDPDELITIAWTEPSTAAVRVHRSLAPDPERRAELERCVAVAVAALIRDRDTVSTAPLTAAAEVLAVHAESAVGQPAAALEGQMAALRERIDATADRVARRRRAAPGDPATS